MDGHREWKVPTNETLHVRFILSSCPNTTKYDQGGSNLGKVIDMDLNFHQICNIKDAPNIGTEQEAAKHKNFPKNEIFKEKGCTPVGTTLFMDTSSCHLNKLQMTASLTQRP